MNLKNKVIVITGAGRGIGKEISRKLATEGANMVLISRTEKEIQETYLEIKNVSPNSIFLSLDISNRNRVESLFEMIIEKFNRIDCLINNAGVQKPIGKFYQNDLGDWSKNIEINLFGTVNMTYFVVKNMIENGGGKIINLSGGGSTSPRTLFSAYSSAKTAIVRFTETLADELKEHNIDVNVISPGAINTNMLAEVLESGIEAGKEYNDALLRKKNGGDNINKVLELIQFLVSDVSNGITGKLISAQWDSWDKEDFRNLLRNDKDFATLRRIDNKTFFKKI